MVWSSDECPTLVFYHTVTFRSRLRPEKREHRGLQLKGSRANGFISLLNNLLISVEKRRCQSLEGSRISLKIRGNGEASMDGLFGLLAAAAARCASVVRPRSLPASQETRCPAFPVSSVCIHALSLHKMISLFLSLRLLRQLTHPGKCNRNTTPN